MDILLEAIESPHKQTSRTSLRIMYNNYDSSFPELLEMSNESTVHIRNIKVLMTEIYKFLNDLSPPIMSDIFEKHEDYYSLRNPRSLASK